MIEYDEYKYDACSITNDECSGCSCRECGVAMSENSASKVSETKSELERYTKFERKSNIRLQRNREKKDMTLKKK